MYMINRETFLLWLIGIFILAIWIASCYTIMYDPQELSQADKIDYLYELFYQSEIEIEICDQ